MREVEVEDLPGGIRFLTISRPEARNALGWRTWEEMEAAVDAFAGDEFGRCLVIAGAGGFFSAGGDLKSPPARGVGLGAPAARLVPAQRVLAKLWRMPKPVVAAVEGAAIGIGWSLALAADVVVAARDAQFRAPFIGRGTVPDGGAAWFITRLGGRQHASRLLFSGDPISAQEAYDSGLVGVLAEPGAAVSAAVELAGRFAKGPADTLWQIKDMIRGATDLSFERFLEYERLSVILAQSGPAAAEGRAAFHARRTPDFSATLDIPRL